MPSLAQSSSYFDTTPIFTQNLTGYQHNADESLPIDTNTTLIIPGTSFSEPTTINVYKGIQNQIQSLIPSGQSSISSYEILFKDATGNLIKPNNAIKIAVINKYSNTSLYYYPFVNNGIDQGFTKQINGTNTLSLLPVNDTGFIAAVNSISVNTDQTPTTALSTVSANPTNMQQNLPSTAAPTILPTAKTKDLNSNNSNVVIPTVQVSSNNITKSQSLKTLITSFGILMILIIILIVLYYLILKIRRKSNLPPKQSQIQNKDGIENNSEKLEIDNQKLI
ncbi:hypothetical protein M1615_02610 [Patescibacteria group bacterium]|nr:hypothetical protein [Patescibacteria group bacterium]